MLSEDSEKSWAQLTQLPPNKKLQALFVLCSELTTLEMLATVVPMDQTTKENKNCSSARALPQQLLSIIVLVVSLSHISFKRAEQVKSSI